MQQNCTHIPLDISSSYSPRFSKETCKTSTNSSTNNRISYDIGSNIYVQNEYNPFKKYTNNLILSKNRELNPSINSQAIQNDYDRQNYNYDRYSESNYNRENLLSPMNRPYSKNRNFFNGHQNKWLNNNDMEKKRENYTYYESKYSRKKNNKRDTNFNNNKVSESVYSNENYNISNIPLKNNNYDSNYNIKKNVDNSNIKKSQNSIIYSKMQSEKLKFSSNLNNNDITDKKNNYNYASSSSNLLDISKDSYHSPVKTVVVEKDSYNVPESNNNSRNKKTISNQSSDKIPINKDILKIKNDIKNRNKQLEMIKLNKSNIIGLKKSSGLKKIPFSPRDKKKSINDNIVLNLIKEKKHKIKNNYSYSEIKPKENRKIFQSDCTEIKDKKNLSVFKGVKLTDNKLFRKAISSQIDQKDIYNNIEKEVNPKSSRNTNIIIKSGTPSLNNDDNNKNINISHNSYSNYNNKEEITRKNYNIPLNQLKKGRNRDINDNKKDEQSTRRVFSHQKMNLYNIINNDKLRPESNKNIPKIKNNLVKSNIIEYNQRVTNDSILNQKKNYDNYTNNNNKTYNKYNNYTEIKKGINNKGPSTLHTIALTKIKPIKLDNIHLSTINPNVTNLTRRLKTPIMTIQNQTKDKLKSPEIDEEDNWDDFEFLSLKKKTYDIGQRQIRKKNKNNMTNLLKKLNSQPSIVKSCESLNIAGRDDEGNKKINQDSFILEKNINGIVNFNIFAVLDGHGENGHYASQFVSRYMINHIKNHPLIKKSDNVKEIYDILKNNGYEIIAKLYLDADIQITKESFDCKNSGTTCVIAIQLGDKIICSNAGDSRAILIFDKDKNNNNLMSSKIYPLSFDCKPDLPNEKKRIHERGGFVGKVFDQYDDQEEGPFRVFEKGEDYPGLAMSRSIGDMDAHKIGVIPNPQIIEYNIDYDTKYMLICSDGIWEFISNEDAMKIGNKYYLRNDAKGLCQELYKTSLDFWLQEDVCVDDITVIAVFF